MGVRKIRGLWHIDFYANGERVRELVGDGKSKILAVAAFHSMKKQVAEDIYLPGKLRDTVKITEILSYYWDKCLSHRRNGGQAKTFLNILKKAFGHLPIAYLRKDRIEQFQRSEAARISELTNRQYTAATVNRIIAFLSAAVNFAIRTGLIRIADNPCKGIKRLPENVRDVVVSEVQFRWLLHNMPDYLKAVVSFAYYTGCRKGEILDLRKTDVDFFQNVIFIRHAKNGESRYVPVDPRIKDLLLAAVNQNPESEYLFMLNGRKIANVTKAFRTACRLAKTPDLHFHDLRHSCLTNWHNAGHSYFVIMKASGHKTISCFKRYLSFGNDDLQRLVSAPDGYAIGTGENRDVANAV